jgi:hypothetical protein
MEPVVAISGNRSQTEWPRKPPKQAQTAAVNCHRLRAPFHGKEGVDGSSPSEGFAEMPATVRFRLPGSKTPVTRGHSRALAAVPSAL